MSVNLKWVLIASLIVVGVGGAAFFGLRSFVAHADLESRFADLSRLHVWFLNPQNGSELPVGSFVQVQAKAESPNGIVAMELWEGGQLVEAVESPESTQNPFWADFSWLPEQVGTFYLTARAVDGDGMKSTSAVLSLEIVPEEAIADEQLNNAYVTQSASVHYVDGAGQGGDGGGLPYVPPSPISSSADDPGSAEEASPWSPSWVKWVGDFFSTDDPPAAPSIVAAVESCRPRIFISDHSDNEDGFIVYRQDQVFASFAQVASLAAYDGPTFTYKDEELYGVHQYYVTAFNSAGEFASNPVTVEILSENCKPEAGDSLTLSLADLLTGVVYDLGYCYYSLDGVNWQRHPQGEGDFFQPMMDGQSDGEHALVGQIAEHGDMLPLDLDCWGWNGGELGQLGAWHWDDLHDDGIFQRNNDPGDLGGSFEPINVMDELRYEEVGDVEFTMLWDYTIPRPYAWVGTGPGQCAAYSNIPNPLILGLICGDIADELDFIAWALEEGCPAQGINPNATCYGPDDIEYYNIYDSMHDGGATPIQTVDAPATIYFLFDPDSCAPRTIQVSAVVDVNGNPHESLLSNQVFYEGNPNCPILQGTAPQNFRITWDTIDFSVGNIDDGVDAEDDVEAYGYMGAWNHGTVPLSWTLQFFFEFEDDPEDNPVSFASIPLCKGWGNQTFCSISKANQLLLINNNTGEFSLFLGEHADWHVSFFDKDDDSADEVICSLDPYVDNMQFFADHIFSPGETVTFTRTKHHNDASCRVTFHVEALP